MRAIIFGINGQDGHYLKLLLEQKGIEVLGVSRSAGNWIQGSVSDHELVNQLVKSHQPDYIFHLAANSTTKHSALFENHETIATGTLILLEAVHQFSPTTKVFLSGSAMQFVNKGSAINEQTPFEASSPYSISRIQSIYAGRYYRSKGLKVYVGYFFNHESPMRGPHHVSKLTTDIIKRIGKGSPEKIELGNVNVQKEWNYAGDLMQAVILMTEQEEQFELILGSGNVHSIADWLNECFTLIGRNWKDHFIQKQGFRSEYEILRSDPKLLYSLGYKPSLNFKGLAELMMKN